MILNNKILILLILFLNFYNFIYSEEIRFDIQYGDWSIASNWDLKRKPTSEDYSIILENQVAVNFIEKIESKRIDIGDFQQENHQISILNAYYGIAANEVYIVPNCGLVLQNNQLDPFTMNQEYYFEINLYNFGSLLISNSSYYAPFRVIVNRYSNDEVINSNLIVGAINSNLNSTSKFYRSEVYLSLLLLDLESTIFFNNSLLYVDDIYISPFIQVLNDTYLIFLDSTFISTSLLNIVDGYIGFKNTSVDIKGNSSEIFSLDSNIYVEECNSFSIKNNISFSGNVGQFAIKYSKVNLEGFLFFYNKTNMNVFQTVLVSKSMLFFTGNSDSSIMYSNVTLTGYHSSDNSFCTFLDSNVNILDNGLVKLSITLMDNSVMYFKGGNINLNSSLYTSGKSILVGVDSKISIGEDSFFNADSIIEMNSTNFIIENSLTMSNYSTFYSFDSTITISNYTHFQDFSTYVFTNSNVIIDGQFFDISRRHLLDDVVNKISSSNLKIKGSYFNGGASYFENSIIHVSGKLHNLIYSGLRFIECDIKVDNYFINDFYTSLENSNLKITNGSLVSNSSSLFYSVNSTIDITGGEFIIASLSNITLSNTTLVNYNGVLETKGDIIINENGILTNNAHFILNSNIFLKNSNQSNSGDSGGDKNKVFTNKGILDIGDLNNTITSTNITNILINFNNENGTINVYKETVFLKLNQDNSNLTLKSENSSITIQENLNSLNDSFTFSIGQNTSSEIKVLKDATIQNPNIIIRISIEFLTNDKGNQVNRTLLTSNNLSNGKALNRATNSLAVEEANNYENVKFKSYDPITGEEKDLDTCRHKVQISQTSIKLLLNSQDECENRNKLSKGQIIGIVFGIIGFVAVVATVIYFKIKPPKSQQLKYRLKKMKEMELQQSQTQQP